MEKPELPIIILATTSNCPACRNFRGTGVLGNNAHWTSDLITTVLTGLDYRALKLRGEKRQEVKLRAAIFYDINFGPGAINTRNIREVNKYALVPASISEHDALVTPGLHPGTHIIKYGIKRLTSGLACKPEDELEVRVEVNGLYSPEMSEDVKQDIRRRVTPPQLALLAESIDTIPGLTSSEALTILNASDSKYVNQVAEALKTGKSPRQALDLVIGTYEWWIRYNIPPQFVTAMPITPIWMAVDGEVWNESVYRATPLHIMTNGGRTYINAEGQVIFKSHQMPYSMFLKTLDIRSNLKTSPPETSRVVASSAGEPKKVSYGQGLVREFDKELAPDQMSTPFAVDLK